MLQAGRPTKSPTAAMEAPLGSTIQRRQDATPLDGDDTLPAGHHRDATAIGEGHTGLLTSSRVNDHLCALRRRPAS